MPHASGNQTALIEGGLLPLADNSIDRILLMHGLEHAGDIAGFLAELRRVLVPGGKILAVTPTVWVGGRAATIAHGALASHLTNHNCAAPCIRPSWCQHFGRPACFARPFFEIWPQILSALFSYFEKAGENLFPRLCGLQIVEATKLVYAPLDGHKNQQKHRRLKPKPVLAPQTQKVQRKKI